ncbi:hypothetical protein SCP_0112150 [Sparassis crispa]|uniref:Uncharacterized protein n=1 Tax=Sparassis crispa TaxID=139825 RepID=A0A401G819_9APHY|nr:hypothetical protein SCP_0112150 [Sparassis crispa]GBE78330.1 hypothetical protein SCP_0112150 [Sparassis crispa]
MKNRHVADLYTELRRTSAQVVKLSDVQTELMQVMQENKQLTQELQALKSEKSRSPSFVSTSTLMPSDSVSHHGGTISQDSSIVSPPVPKKTYPFTVLWNKEDCKKDDDVHITVANPERIPMDQAVRHENGDLISSAEWHAIQTTARVVKNELLSLPPPRDRRYRNIKRTKKVFKAAYPHEWEAAMLKMEKQQLLLALCSDHWKAEYIIGPMLLQQHKPDSELDNDDDDVSHVSTSATNTHASERGEISASMASQVSVANKRRRVHSTSSSKPKKKPVAGVVSQHAEGRTSGPVATPALEPQLSLTSVPVTMPVEPQLSAIGNILAQVPSAPPSVVASVISPSVSGLTVKSAIDISFINVDPSIENLIDALSSSHPDLISGLELLNSMKLTPVFDIGSPTSEVITFIERIENADPNSPDLSEDDLGTAWGHYQFTAGSMTSSSTLVSWDGIGSEAARRLIAASIKTCKVARHVCFVSGIKTNAYLSDAYLETTVEILWRLWKAAGGPVVKGKGKAFTSSDSRTMSTADAIASIPDSSAATLTPSATTLVNVSQPSANIGLSMNSDSCPSNSSGSGKPMANSNSDPRAYITSLNRDELFEWIIDRKLAVNMKLGKKSSSVKKDKLVSIILSAEATAQPSKAEVDVIVQQRKLKKMATSRV